MYTCTCTRAFLDCVCAYGTHDSIPLRRGSPAHLLSSGGVSNTFELFLAPVSSTICSALRTRVAELRTYVHILLFSDHICIIGKLLPVILFMQLGMYMYQFIIIANNWPLHRQSRHYHHLNTSTSPKPNYTRQSTLGGCSVCTYTHTHTHTMTYAVL